MSILTKRVVVVSGESYDHLADALELTRRYIRDKRAEAGNDHSVNVDEHSAPEIRTIERAMDAFWGN